MKKRKRYSKYLKPIMVLLDIFIIVGVLFLIADREFLNLLFLSYAVLFWVIVSFFTGLYRISRVTSYYRVLTLLAKQFLLFALGYFSFFSLFREGDVVNNQTRVLVYTTIGVTLFKYLFLIFLKEYRSEGKNFRKVIVVGSDDSAKKLMTILENKKSLGYVLEGFFSDKESNEKRYLGKTGMSYQFIESNDIDEIYCSLTELTNEEIKAFTKYANSQNRVLKLIPNANELYNKNLATEYYDDSLLVLSVQKMPFEYFENLLIKRSFDIVFSCFVLVFILSWLTPLLWVLIKIESRGPALFRQKREGLNGHQFNCYKFRSMRIDASSSQKHTSKNDHRVTKLGSFLRKTSLDELPQFYNVLKGDMSIVGPRPHLQSLSVEYQKDVDNYIQRHAVKPGITGLAQVSGYRGEIKRKYEIQNRIRLDIFYIENWSFFLDIKIILQTIFNVFKGEEKAY